MLKEMIVKEVTDITVGMIKENKGVIIAGATKIFTKIPKHVPAIAAGVVIGYGAKIAVDKYKEHKEEKLNDLKEQMREEIISELNNK